MEIDHTITQVLGYWVVTAWAQIQLQNRLQGICAGQIGRAAHFYPSALCFPTNAPICQPIIVQPTILTVLLNELQNQSTNLDRVVKHKTFCQFYPLTILINTADS